MNVTRPGSKKPAKKSVKVDQKQMVYYSEKYAKKQKADRDAMIARANDLINHPKKYDRVTSKGSATYVKNIAFDKSTDEIIDDRNLELDTKKISEEEKYDGYYSIVTSELQMKDEEMRRVYRGLAKIEDSFKITLFTSELMVTSMLTLQPVFLLLFWRGSLNISSIINTRQGRS